MQSALDLGEDHVSAAELEAELLALNFELDKVQAQIYRKEAQLKRVRGGVILRCAHCEAEYPYRELMFLVEERYSHTPAYEDSVYVEQNWGYRCPKCNKSSWWGRPVADDVKSPEGIRKLFKSVEVTQSR